MRIAGPILAILAALIAQTTLAWSLTGHRSTIDLVLVVVIYVALVSGPVGGLMAGTVAGIAQDGLSGGIIGVGGLAKSLVGFFVGVIGRQFIVAHPLPRFVVFSVGTLAHAACFLGMYQLIDPGPFDRLYRTATTQALVNGVVGLLAFHVVERAPLWLQRRRARRSEVTSRARF